MESDAVRNRWEPQVYFAPKVMSSQILNIDERGLRRTANSAVAAMSSSTTKIALFGGSTMFGYGARDDETIPSIVSRLLRQGGDGRDVFVTNFGRIAYTSSQELLQLMHELKAGRVPDIVIFYDGVNDVETAMLGMNAGFTYSEGRLAQFVEGQGESLSAAVKLFMGRTRMMRFMTRYARRNREPDVLVKLRSIDVDALTRDVARVYGSNIALVSKLGEVYGFDCLFYLQPTLYQKPQRTSFEESIFERPWYEGLPKSGCEAYNAFYANSYEAVRQVSKPQAGFHDISALFADDPTARYIDPQHLGESGNDVVAHRMAQDITRLIDQQGRK